MASQTEMQIIVRAIDEASANLKKIQNSVSDLGDKAKTGTKSVTGLAGAFALGNIAAMAGSKIFGFVVDNLKDMVTEAATAGAGQAQLAAVITSTGGAAGVSAQMANELASRFANLTTYTDDEVLSVENLLLTNTNLTKNSFPEAIQAVLDMSVAMGQDLKSSTLQVAKALQDPIANIGALTRNGVIFTEQTKEQIQTLVQSGKGLEAQKIILGEVSKEFGGSAAAAAQTFQGKMKILDNTISEVKENLGKQLLPALGVYIDMGIKSAKETQNATAKNNDLAIGLYGLAQIIKSVGLFVKGLGQMFMFLAEVAVSAVAIVGSAIYDIARQLDKIALGVSKIMQGLALILVADFEGAKKTIQHAFDGINFDATKHAIKTAGIVLNEFSNAAMDSFVQAGDALNEALIQKGFKAVTDAVVKAKTPVDNFGEGAKSAAKKAEEAFNKAVISLRDLAETTKTKMLDILDSYTQKSEQILEEHSKKVNEINASIATTKEDFEKNSADAQKSYQDSVVSSFISQQDKMTSLLKEREDLQKQVNAGTASDSDNAKLIEVAKELDAQKIIIAQYSKEFADIEKLAADERAKTDLDKLKAQHLSETAQRQADFDAKMADLNLKMQAEQDAYTKQKEALVADTIDKYAKINDEVQKGWQKILDDTKIKVDQMKVLEQTVTAIKTVISTAQTAVGATTGVTVTPKKLASGGIVNSPTFAMIGEAGPEAVVPLNGNSGGLGNNITINIGNLWGANPQSAAREIGDLIIKRLQMNARVG